MRLGTPFRRLWVGNAFGNLADGIAFVSIPLLATLLTDSPLLIAGLASAYALTRLLVALPVGVQVDRLDRRRLLWVANAVRGAALIGLGLALLGGVASIWALYVVYCAVGVAENIADNAAVSTLPDLVDDEQLDQANSRISAVQLVADEFVGPPLGGLLFALAAPLPIAVTGLLYLGAAAFFQRLPVRSHHERGPQPRRGVWTEARDGLRWMAGHREIRFLAGLSALANFAYMVPFSILVLFARDQLGLSATGYGLLLAASALGGLVGAAAAPALRRRLGHPNTLATALALGAATLIGLSFTTDAVIAGVLLALYILHATVFSITATALRQRLVPDQFRGRTHAGFRVLALIGLALGGLVGGGLAQITSLTIPVLVGGCAFLVATIAVAVGWPSARSPDEVRERAATPEPDGVS